ncbi:hypothetical protein CIB48_g8852 [Xylaria polymorpha]|nr:hypothetical protein CIB48_g8852 [Xylaria polymorpha]
MVPDYLAASRGTWRLGTIEWQQHWTAGLVSYIGSYLRQDWKQGEHVCCCRSRRCAATAYSLQPTAYSLQPTAYSLQPTAYSLQCCTRTRSTVSDSRPLMRPELDDAQPRTTQIRALSAKSIPFRPLILAKWVAADPKLQSHIAKCRLQDPGVV